VNLLQKTLLAALLAVSSSAFAGIVEVDNASLKDLQKRGVAIIDVRREDEWRDTGILAGSHGLTFFDEKGRYDAKAWLGKLSELVGKDEPFVLICSRGVRSAKIASLLDERLNFEGVHNVTQGILGWINGNNPVVGWGNDGEEEKESPRIYKVERR